MPTQHPQRPVYRLILWVMLLAGVAIAPRPAHAAGTVTDCSTYGPAVGTLQVALTGGGTVTFACDGTIIVPEITISQNTVVDASGHDVTLSGNNANRVFVVASGGNLTLASITIANAKAPTGNPYGGDILNAGALTIDGSTIHGNQASDGAGIYSSGQMEIRNSTISNNGASVSVCQDGGGIYTAGTLVVDNSTIAANSCNFGAGISSRATETDPAKVIIRNSTIRLNNAYSSAGGLQGVATLKNTIVIDNSSTFGQQDMFGNWAFAFVSQGYNMIGSPYDIAIQPTDITGVTSLLSPLGDYGGTTQTMALLPNSPAINAGDPACPAADQRGVARVGGCDIGAFESRGLSLAYSAGSPQSTPVNTAFANPLVVTVSSAFAEPVNGGQVIFTAPGSGASLATTPLTASISSGSASQPVSANGAGGSYTVNADTRGNLGGPVPFNLTNLDCSANSWSVGNEIGLNFAIGCYNGKTVAGTYTINITQDIDLTASTPIITNNSAGVSLVIAGGGFTVDGQGISGVKPFNIQGGPVTINNLTVTGGNSTAGAGGIYNNRSLTLNNCTVTGNSAATVGGGIRSIGTLTLNNSTVSGNTAGTGGGISVEGGSASLDSLTVADNSATTGGGIAQVGGTVTLVNTIVGNNSASGSGPDLAGIITSANHNLVENTSGATFTPQGSDITGQDPQLGALANNGGPTQTHALLPGSPAINAGDTTLTTDQRGVARPQGAADDIGAVEVQVELDFGDAPDSYRTTLASNGAANLIGGISLRTSSSAAAPDAEPDGQPTAGADGDDTIGVDDENGVLITGAFTPGQTSIAAVSVTGGDGVLNTVDAVLSAWFDWNRDGDFLDPGEAVTIDQAVDTTGNASTAFAVSVQVPAGAVPGLSYARFRLTAGATGSTNSNSPTGVAGVGEVEDYQVTISNPTLATVGDFGVKLTSVDDVLAALAGKNGDPAALLALLATWDPELAKRLEGADAETLAAALRHYLDPDGDGMVAVVRWDTLQEHGTVGFYVERAEGDGWTRLNGGLLPGLIDAPQGGEYWLFDPDVTAGTYHYRLVELEAWGSERLHGPWAVQVSAATRTAGRSTLAQTAAPTTDAEDADQWSEWRGLAQGFAARKRVPPPPPAQPLAAPQAAPATAPTGALWLRTQAEGLYRVPTAQLAALLGDQADQVRKWLSKDKKLALVNAGAPVPWYYDAASDALYFVAQEYRTLHTNENAYRLAKNNAPSLTMAERTGAGPAAGSPAGTFRETLRLEQDLTFSLWPIKDDTEADYWFWDYLYAGTSHDAVTVPLTLPGAATTGQGQLRVFLRGWTDYETGNDHRVSATLNGTALGAPLEWDGFTTAVLTVPFDQALLAKGNSLTLLSQKINAAVTKNPGQWLDRIEAAYQREPKAENGQLWLHGLAAGTHTVAGFNKDANAIYVIEAPATARAVWRRDVTIASTGAGWQVSFNAPQGGDFLVVDSTALRTPKAEIDATSTLAKANNRADYLIVAPRALAQTADALAAYRVGNQRKVEIAWLDDIYDEFSAGRTDPRAISDFLAQVYRNWKRVPEYVVLLGNGTLDHRNRQGYGDSLLPVRMMMSPWGLLVSDHRYTDMNGDGRSKYAFGRIPATTDAQGLAYVQKMQAATSAPRRAMVVADDPDSGGDFHTNANRQAEELKGLLGRRSSVTKFYHPTDAVSAALTDSANWNVAYLSYDGHGSALQLGNSSENFLTIANAKALTNGKLPVFVALTCEAGDGSQPGLGGSVAGALALNPAGGALAALAPTGVSLDAQAQVIGSAFADHLLGGRLSVGQAAREAQTQSAGQVAPFMLGVYQILGDPAAQLP